VCYSCAEYRYVKTIITIIIILSSYQSAFHVHYVHIQLVFFQFVHQGLWCIKVHKWNGFSAETVDKDGICKVSSLKFHQDFASEIRPDHFIYVFRFR